MRIALSAMALIPGGSGVQTYCRELLAALPRHVDASLVAVVQRQSVALVPDGISTRARRDCDGFARTLQSLRPLRGHDLVHALDVDLPLRTDAATVSTVHDVALFDTPGAFGSARRLGKQATTRSSIERADYVIAPSAFTAERVRDRFGRDSAVILEAPSPGFEPPDPEVLASWCEARGLPGRFVAYVGNLEPRKDVGTLERACRAAGLPLVVAGSHIRTVDVPSGARDLGHLHIDDLRMLYAAATVVAYVSRYEGFGLPPVEAMACGGVVMATRVGALPDIAAEAVCFVGFGDVEGQTATLTRIANDSDERAARRVAGIEAVAQLSWNRTAAETAKIYRVLGVG